MKKNTLLVIALLMLCIIIAVVPLLFVHGTEFGGADGKAEDAITQINPDYEPWASSLIELPGGETETLLFCVQTAIGAGILAFGFGYLAAKKKYEKAQ